MSIRHSFTFCRIAQALASLCIFILMGFAQAQVTQSTRGSAPASFQQATPLKLSVVLDWVKRLPDVGVALQQWESAKANIQIADHAPLPVASIKAGSIDLQNGIGNGTILGQKRVDKALGVDWTWERGDKRLQRTLTAQNEAAAAYSEYLDVVVQKNIEAYIAYFQLKASQQRFEELNDLLQSSVQLERISQLRLKAGDISQQDVSRIAIETLRAQTDVLTARLENQKSIRTLAIATGIATPADQWFAADNWPEQQASFLTQDFSDQQFLASIESRPDVIAAKQRVTAAEFALKSAQALKSTDVTVGSSFDHYPPDQRRSVELRMQFPLQWGYSYQGEIVRAQTQLQIAKDTLQKVVVNASSQLSNAWSNVKIAAQRLQAFENEMAPKAQQVLEQAELAFQKGGISLTDLLEARRIYRTTRLDVVNAKLEFSSATGAWQMRTQNNNTSSTQPVIKN